MPSRRQNASAIIPRSISNITTLSNYKNVPKSFLIVPEKEGDVHAPAVFRWLDRNISELLGCNFFCEQKAYEFLLSTLPSEHSTNGSRRQVSLWLALRNSLDIKSMEADQEIFKVQGPDGPITDGTVSSSSEPAAAGMREFTMAELQDKYKQLQNDVGKEIKHIWDVETSDDDDLKLRLLASLKQNECLMIYPDLYFARAKAEIVQYNKYSPIDQPVQMLQWILENGPIGYLKCWETQQLKNKKIEWNTNVRKLECDLETYVRKLTPLIDDIKKTGLWGSEPSNEKVETRREI